MPCNFPLKAYRNLAGGRPLFKKSDSAAGEEIDLPCNNCMACKKEYTRQWAMRCTHEASLHEQNAFITLTYNDEHIPSNGSLEHKDFQDFLKRLRKQTPPIKYYMCGEYGDAPEGGLGRPHYHALIFGYQWPDLEQYGERNGHPIYGSEKLTSTWQKGHIEIGSVTFESACYVAGYVGKKLRKSHYGFTDRYTSIDTRTGELSYRNPEYCQMSRGGRKRADGTQARGIAAEWWDKYKGDLEKDFITMRGQRMRPPRYYDRLLEKEEPDTHQAIKEKRRADAVALPGQTIADGFRKEKAQKVRFKKRSKRA